MKSNRTLLTLALFFAVCMAPAYGANKDLIELQTQVSQLQQQMTQMKQSFDERMGVMKSLLDQNTD
ncbi:MAG: transporter, partial [Terriglobales bacterium]